MGSFHGLGLIITLIANLGFSGSGLLELPAITHPERLLFHPGCVLSYNLETRQPDWVAYRLTAAEAGANLAERTNRFRPDPQRPGVSGVDRSYVRSGYDRGHLAPAADFRFSRAAMTGSFFFSNISPQEPALNRGLWSRLEGMVREEALRQGAVYVISGPVFFGDRVTRGRAYIGEDRIPVPDAFFKALLAFTPEGPKTIAFILPNGPVANDLPRYALSVDEVEEVTGIDLFSLLGEDSEARAESNFDYSLWFSD